MSRWTHDHSHNVLHIVGGKDFSRLDSYSRTPGDGSDPDLIETWTVTTYNHVWTVTVRATRWSDDSVTYDAQQTA